MLIIYKSILEAFYFIYKSNYAINMVNHANYEISLE